MELFGQKDSCGAIKGKDIGNDLGNLPVPKAVVLILKKC